MKSQEIIRVITDLPEGVSRIHPLSINTWTEFGAKASVRCSESDGLIAMTECLDKLLLI